MSNYLTRLVDRTLGLAPQVHPIIGSRFGRGLDIAADLEAGMSEEHPLEGAEQVREHGVAPWRSDFELAKPAEPAKPADPVSVPEPDRAPDHSSPPRFVTGSPPVVEGERARNSGPPAEAREQPANAMLPSPLSAPSPSAAVGRRQIATPVIAGEHREPRIASEPRPSREARAVEGDPAPLHVQFRERTDEPSLEFRERAETPPLLVPARSSSPHAFSVAMDPALPATQRPNLPDTAPDMEAAERPAVTKGPMAAQTPLAPPAPMILQPPPHPSERAETPPVLVPARSSSSPRAFSVTMDPALPATQRPNLPDTAHDTEAAERPAVTMGPMAAQAPLAPPAPMILQPPPRLIQPSSSAPTIAAARASALPVPSPAQPRGPAASPASAAEPAPQVIRVHIGRVDVRAATPAAPPPAPAKPRLGLAEYLERHSRGAR